MKFGWGATQQEKDEIVRKTIIRLAKSLHNACKDSYKLNNCSGCVYKVGLGRCSLNGHPIAWSDKFKTN